VREEKIDRRVDGRKTFWGESGLGGIFCVGGGDRVGKARLVISTSEAARFVVWGG